MAIRSAREYLADRLAEVLYDRGDDIRKWPEDEAEAYREFRFSEGMAAANRLKFLKAADAILDDPTIDISIIAIGGED